MLKPEVCQWIVRELNMEVIRILRKEQGLNLDVE
jgi:hypothetical protein